MIWVWLCFLCRCLEVLRGSRTTQSVGTLQISSCSLWSGWFCLRDQPQPSVYMSFYFGGFLVIVQAVLTAAKMTWCEAASPPGDPEHHELKRDLGSITRVCLSGIENHEQKIKKWDREPSIENPEFRIQTRPFWIQDRKSRIYLLMLSRRQNPEIHIIQEPDGGDRRKICESSGQLFGTQ